MAIDVTNQAAIKQLNQINTSFGRGIPANSANKKEHFFWKQSSSEKVQDKTCMLKNKTAIVQWIAQK
jgi:hypothetical protein